MARAPLRAWRQAVPQLGLNLLVAFLLLVVLLIGRRDRDCRVERIRRPARAVRKRSAKTPPRGDRRRKYSAPLQSAPDFRDFGAARQISDNIHTPAIAVPALWG
jgi:hypothetical protein